jgi:lipid-A-disaccharide synthase
MPLRVLIIAGEASGDLHGAALLRALRQRVDALDAWGIGGVHLQAAGMRLLVDMRSVATMGFVETFGTIGRIVAAYRRVIRFLDEQHPQLVVLIDYPEFNLRIARQVKRRGIPVFYFIAPQVWAWRRGRVRQIKRLVDKMAVVFPFEPGLYNDGRTMAEFIGHPLLDVVAPTRSREETRRRYGIEPGRRMLALLPGSRRKEVRYLLGPLCAAAAELAAEGWRPVIALATSLSKADLDDGLEGTPPLFPVAEDDTYNVVAAADAAVVASGTATLETALLGCPMVIVYRMARLTHWLARRLVRVDWIGMPNIILQQPVFPELIQAEATPEAIAAAVRSLQGRRPEIASALATLRSRLGAPGAADRAAALALTLVPDSRATSHAPQPTSHES